jgi:hypothetical protein
MTQSAERKAQSVNLEEQGVRSQENKMLSSLFSSSEF